MIKYEDLTEAEKMELNNISTYRQDKIDSFFNRAERNLRHRSKESFEKNQEFNDLLEKNIVSHKSDYYYKNRKWELVE